MSDFAKRCQLPSLGLQQATPFQHSSVKPQTLGRYQIGALCAVLHGDTHICRASRGSVSTSSFIAASVYPGSNSSQHGSEAAHASQLSRSSLLHMMSACVQAARRAARQHPFIPHGVPRSWLLAVAPIAGQPGPIFPAPPSEDELVPAPSGKSFRYWIDFQVLSSPESTVLLERALRRVGGVRTGGPPKLDPVTAAVQKFKDYGYMHMGEWDFLWSITAKAMLAAEVLRPGQLVSIVPGFLSITRKTSLVSSLRLVYGDATAFTIVPLTFKLPDELDKWADWLKANPEADTGMWMMKNNKQRGTGLRLVRTQDAFAAVWETTTRPGLEGMLLYRWYLAQQYITRPLLIGGRKFGIRLWALVPGLAPLRVYAHTRGLVLFSSHRYNSHDTQAADGGIAPGHITNYAQNENGMVWPLSHLASHLGQAAWQGLWRAMLRSTALSFAAALPRAQEVQRQMSLPPRSTFQFFGLDFLVDEDLVPWLLEVNATPSMKVEHEDPGTKRVIHDEKWPVMRDMVSLLGICSERFNGRAPSEPKDLGFMSGELAQRGGFVPLMHLLPLETPGDGLRTITWQPLDHEMRAYTRSAAYQQAIAGFA